MRLKGKVAFITGFSSGIGQATAILFAREGAAVAGISLEEVEGRATLEKIQQQGGRGLFCVADVRDSAKVNAFMEEVVTKFGGLDIIVNSAGIATRGTIAQVSEEDWDSTLDTNLKGIYLVNRLALPRLIDRGGGVIINVSALVGMTGKGGRAVQSASKGGVITLTEAMAADHAPQKIRVNCICPGPTQTPMHDKLAKGYTPDIELRRFRLGRMGSPEDAAYVALFLASDEAQYVTGAIIPVDGGARLPSD